MAPSTSVFLTGLLVTVAVAAVRTPTSSVEVFASVAAFVAVVATDVVALSSAVVDASTVEVPVPVEILAEADVFTASRTGSDVVAIANAEASGAFPSRSPFMVVSGSVASPCNVDIVIALASADIAETAENTSRADVGNSPALALLSRSWSVAFLRGVRKLL